MNPKNLPKRTSFSRRAFSLIELLVVMAVIGILSGLAITSFNSIGRGSGARGAADLAASLALSARIEAMSMGHGSLLVIENGNNPDRKLQRMAVLRYTNTPDPNNLGANTVLVGKPTALPRGVFFLPEYSKPRLANSTTLTNLPGSPSTEVLYLRFNGSGQLVTSDNRLVFSGNVMDGNGSLQNPDAMIQGRQGIILRSNGRPVFFNRPDQMAKNP